MNLKKVYTILLLFGVSFDMFSQGPPPPPPPPGLSIDFDILYLFGLAILYAIYVLVKDKRKTI